MAEICIYNCGRGTNNVDRICAGCAMDIHLEGQPRHMTKEEFEDFNTDTENRDSPRRASTPLGERPYFPKKEELMPFKKCPECGTEQKGNAAPKCHECGHIFVKGETKKKPVKQIDEKPRVSRRKPSVSGEGGKAARPEITEPGNNGDAIMGKLVDAYFLHVGEAAKVKVAISTVAAVAGIEMPDLDEMEARIL